MEKQAVYEMEKKEMQIIETEHKEKYALDKITAYVKMFTNANGREPIADEIREHFAEQEDSIFIEKFIVGSALDNV